jgi:hypothetical protein
VLAAVTLALVIPFVTLLAVDVYLHRRFEKSAGFNIWGYRGPVVPKKQPGEYRVVMLGGSAAYGYGVTWDQAIPAVVERRLAGRTQSPARVSVINLGCGIVNNSMRWRRCWNGGGETSRG